VAQAQRTGCPLEFALTLLDLESSGGLNIFGTPKKPCGQPRNREVTEATYRAYLSRRTECGTQGVGPLQLTWGPTQDLADQQGGCWRPEVNVQVGLGVFAGHLQRYGERDAFSRWNTGASGDTPYSQRAMAMLPGWRMLVEAAA